jgi:hypothetical protein
MRPWMNMEMEKIKDAKNFQITLEEAIMGETPLLSSVAHIPRNPGLGVG